MPSGIPLIKLKRRSDGQGYEVSDKPPKVSRMQSAVPLSNRFGILATADSGEPSGTLRAPKAPRLESFTVVKEQISALANVQSLVGLYNTKRERNGDVTLFPRNAEAIPIIKAEVAKLGWYSRQLEKEYKYVLYGLSEMDPTKLMPLINSAAAGRFTAKHASRMTIKNPLYQGQANYLIYFNQNPTLPVLRDAISDIEGAIPSWVHYHNNKRGDKVSIVKKLTMATEAATFQPNAVSVLRTITHLIALC